MRIETIKPGTEFEQFLVSMSEAEVLALLKHYAQGKLNPGQGSLPLVETSTGKRIDIVIRGEGL